MKIFEKLFSIFRSKNNDGFTIPKSTEFISKEFLLNIPKELRQQEIYNHIIDYEIDFDKEAYEEVMKMNKGHQMIYLIWHLQSEINNGGYFQFFDNFENCNKILQPYYDLISEHLIIVKEFHNDFIKAISVYKKLRNAKSEKEEEKYDKELYELDTKFYDYEQKLITAVDDYIDSHINDFIS
ncbi:MAG: DUF4375 domain-containing protein [Bacilli bacterium]|nr:DUF4375 domain-containing protein [Bacilli bacterium]